MPVGQSVWKEKNKQSRAVNGFKRGREEDKEEEEVVVVAAAEVLDPLDNRGGMVEIFTTRWRLARRKAELTLLPVVLQYKGGS